MYIMYMLYLVYIYISMLYIFKVFVCKYSSLLVYKVFVMLFLLHCCYCLELYFVLVVLVVVFIVFGGVECESVNELHGQKRNLTNMKRRIRRAVREFKLYLKSCQLCAVGRQGGRGRMCILCQRHLGKCKQIGFHDVE